MTNLVEYALQAAARGWRVFPLSRSKVPFKGTHGHLDATTDPAAIEAMWREHPSANVGLATGFLVVLDADGPAGAEAFRALGAPKTLVARTPRGGLHFYYRAPAGVEIRCHNAPRAEKGGPGLDIKGHGGYVLLPPSRDRQGRQYQWANAEPIAELTHELIQYAQSVGAHRKSVVALELPEHLRNRATRNLVARAAVDRLEWTAHNEARIRSALKSIGNKIGYDQFLRIGFGLHHLQWERSDGENAGFMLWNEWSSAFPETYNPEGLAKKWESFGKHEYSGQQCTIGTVFAMAQEAGWSGEVESVVIPEKVSLPVPFFAAAGDPDHANVIGLAAVFPDTDKAGRPRSTCTNTRVALEALGVQCRHDVFHNRFEIGGKAIDRWAGEVSDTVVQAVRPLIRETYGFDPGLQNANDAAVQLCLVNQYHPIKAYLAGLQWDRVPRLGTWLANYLGAEASRLNAQFGTLSLVAAVRRIRAPGAKFDEITVLEGPEGANKSTAIQILAGEGNFSDQPILTLDDRAQQEALCGVWLYEIADLTGISRADVDRIKAFASRCVDRTRPAYGRHRIDAPRTCVFFGTTNNERYLQSQTGNRRFWPVRVGTIALAQLERDRDQLWAEACVLEARAHGTDIRLGAEHWHEASAVQDMRLEADPWEDILRNIAPDALNIHERPDGRGQEMRVATTEIFTRFLTLDPGRLTAAHPKRVAFIMRRLGWDGPKLIWQRDKPVKGYVKNVS